MVRIGLAGSQGWYRDFFNNMARRDISVQWSVPISTGVALQVDRLHVRDQREDAHIPLDFCF